MDRPFDKDIAARQSAKVSPALAKARPKNQPAEDPAAPTDASAATLGVSDLAATREVRADLADRLPDVERVAHAVRGGAKECQLTGVWAPNVGVPLDVIWQLDGAEYEDSLRALAELARAF